MLLLSGPPLLSTMFPFPKDVTVHLVSGSTSIDFWNGLVIWDGAPLGFFVSLALLLPVFSMVAELKYELRQDDAEKEEISLAP